MITVYIFISNSIHSRIIIVVWPPGTSSMKERLTPSSGETLCLNLSPHMQQFEDHSKS